MKIKLLTIILLLSWSLTQSQSELYVLSKDISLTNNADCDRIDDRGLFKSYDQGRFVISQNQATVNVNAFIDIIVEDEGDFGCGGPCGQGNIETENCSFTNGDQVIAHYQKIYSKYTGSEPANCFTCMPLSYQAILLPRLITPVDKKCEKEILFPQYPGGQNKFVPELKWQYENASGQFVDLPNHKNRYPLNVSLLDIFGTNWRSNFNGNLNLQFVISADFTTQVVKSSIVTISINECTPDLVAGPIPVDLECSYDENASFELKLGRNLFTDRNEELIVTLNSLPDNQLIGQKSTTSLISNSDGTYSYKWPEELKGGNYSVIYQTKIGNNPSSLSPLSSFEIKTPSNFQFKVEKLNDKSCFENSDGMVRITVDKFESGRTFQYRLYKVSGSAVTVFKDWTDFSSDSFDVGGLDESTFRIKVRDNKKCYAR
ncbi:hypothetical protein [Tenacibaculum sp. 190524A05c]|uniref:hypothetical protein n=1 Tax=Tenacibaculum platacis TaxID=3137852 RepID=UPI0032B2830A